MHFGGDRDSGYFENPLEHDYLVTSISGSFGSWWCGFRRALVTVVVVVRVSLRVMRLTITVEDGGSYQVVRGGGDDNGVGDSGGESHGSEVVVGVELHGGWCGSWWGHGGFKVMKVSDDG
ncbi:hypothetical protein L1987_58218 [Smallanthus sonchifolius]|uniref:Uncharacterized protein n=1 Tax=Smallanthus sonchifolius TaxID=185202 RepID=A0ACB9DF72_9ASTR|nr:hypothetical protein L1987_58218 [Smallanthus sonchifolius]